ncbi:MAG: diacylglyceryl transferase [Flavobacteriales bacterium]|nr:diacylglyceryl transferase [Flavobacteriales bacterium]|tara:strand:- start:1187 stop:1495 length:309 start_codon:yes stop_codon:yes gene_type:complete
MKKLKEKWGITSNFQLIIILLVFSITGSIAVFITKPILNLIGLDGKTAVPWIFWPIRILIIFPIYQILILIIGTLFGQFKFFWNFEKKMLSRLRLKKFLEKD